MHVFGYMFKPSNIGALIIRTGFGVITKNSHNSVSKYLGPTVRCGSADPPTACMDKSTLVSYRRHLAKNEVYSRTPRSLTLPIKSEDPFQQLENPKPQAQCGLLRPNNGFKNTATQDPDPSHTKHPNLQTLNFSTPKS